MNRIHAAFVSAAAALLLAATACTSCTSDATTAADTLTRRQKDSIISTFPIPGAAGVGRALDAADAAAERERLLDSIGR